MRALGRLWEKTSKSGKMREISIIIRIIKVLRVEYKQLF